MHRYGNLLRILVDSIGIKRPFLIHSFISTLGPRVGKSRLVCAHQMSKVKVRLDAMLVQTKYIISLGGGANWSRGRQLLR